MTPVPNTHVRDITIPAYVIWRGKEWVVTNNRTVADPCTRELTFRRFGARKPVKANFWATSMLHVLGKVES